MTFDDAQKHADAAETAAHTTTGAQDRDDYPTGMLASPNRTQL